MTDNNSRIYYIYKIVNNVNGKSYIGQRTCPIGETPETDNYMGSGVYLKSAKEKYGIENFSKEIIAYCHSKKILDILEIEYIKIYREIGKAEYNLADGGEGGVYHFTPEQCENVSKALKKALSDPEIRKKYSAAREKWWREVGLTPEQRERWSESQRGKVLTEEHKRHISEGLVGTVHSEESKEKVRQKLKGRKLPEEQRRKLSESRKGQKLSEETKRKLQVIANRESLLAMMSPYNWRKDILTYWKETPKVKTKAIIENDGKYHWYHCGTENVRAKECPPGFEPGRYVSHKSSEETKKKQSDWWKNLSEEEKEEHRRKLREARKNRVFTAETCRKISEAKKGKPGRKQSEETKQKISSTLKGRKCTWGVRDDREDS
jgi:hypothetical protein